MNGEGKTSRLRRKYLYALNEMMSALNTWLELNGKKYFHNDLLSGDSKHAGSEIEKTILDFCREWLSGASEFTLTTSGSTGKPQEITLSRKAMEASARGTAAALGLRMGDTALLCLDARFIAGKMMLVRSFVTGMNILVTAPAANPFENLPADVKFDFAALVPYQLRSIIASTDAPKLNSVRTLIIGGAEVDAKVRATLNQFSTDIYATYGMTETISHVALQKLNHAGAQDYFQALPGVVLSKDERGCLVISADYLGTEKTVTNDLVDLLSADQFRWLGRWDNVINSGGVKVIPEKVEKEVLKIFVTQHLENRFFVAGFKDEKLGSKVVLVVEGKLSPQLQKVIHQSLENVLTKYELPKELICIDRFIDTDTQKLNRKETVLKAHDYRDGQLLAP
jgi:o-succinylbenzoate---CoA ligase